MNAYRLPYPNELYHYGIVGQKWGIRRFQNSDGSLTPAGRARYGEDGKGESKYEAAMRKAEAKQLKAYEKYTRTAKKLDTKANKFDRKAAANQKKSLALAGKFGKKKKSEKLAVEAVKLQSKSAKLNKKRIKSEKRGEKAYKRLMELQRASDNFYSLSESKQHEIQLGYEQTKKLITKY